MKIESESLIKRELAATDLSTVATALLTSGEKKVVELTVKNCENCENEKKENMLKVYWPDAFCWQVFLLCHEDGDLNREEQEAAEHPRDPLHDLQLDDRGLLLLHPRR